MSAVIGVCWCVVVVRCSSGRTMTSSLARRIFTTTLAILILGPLTSGFTIHRTDSSDQIVADQNSQESVQLQVKDISRRPNDINDGKNEFTSKAATVTTVPRSEVYQSRPQEGSDVPEVAIADLKLPPNIEKTTAKNVNENQATPSKTPTTKGTEENSTVISSAILQVTQLDTNPLIKEDSSNMKTEEGTTLNIDQMATDSETNADLSTGKDSTSSESKTDTTTFTSEITKDNVVGESTPELTTTEEIVFRNSKTPEILVTKEVSQLDNTPTVDISTSNSDEKPSTTTVPSWKKYVTIDRKRTSSEEITTELVERDQKPSEISQTIAEAPLELSVLLQNNEPITSTDTYSQVEASDIKSMEKERLVSSDDIRFTTVSTIDTKRAGFLDLSKSSSSEPTSTTDKITETFKPLASLSEATTTKKASVAESQSQLTEDAINEELLREEMIINHKENTIRHQKVQQIDDEKQIMEVAPVSKEANVPQTSTEYSLSVQPITQDRKTTLYTISPNYKPMKKIDVQPPKPFVRDPDDNSWRNESISSLGIVFKPKNATKSFKEVLKNKTETEFYNITENKDSKNELPDLRVRLEKIAEVRKSKKKKTYKSGEVIYTDYEENNSGETSSTTTTEKIDNKIFDLLNFNSSSLTTETTSPMPFIKLETKTDKMSDDLFKKFNVDTLTTGKPKKYFNPAEYYDTTDEYDADYVTLPKIDLKKFTRPYKTTVSPPTSPATSRYNTKPMSRPQFPERKPTVQYFPPRTTQNVNIDHYDDDFQKKVNYYTSKDKTNFKDFFSFTNLNDPIATEKPTTTTTPQFKYTAYPSDKTTKDVYVTTPTRLSSPHGFVLNDENFNRGSYVIKHYKDFLNEAAKASEFDKIPDFVYPDHPEKVNGLTASPPLDAGDNPPRKTTENDYDYETEFRKDVLHRFVENFNQNSERFKIDFPILYNNSIVHQKFDDNGRVASSTAFMKRLYGSEVGTKPSPFSSPRKSCEPNCDMTVELSPAYELHYFVPEQEEKESPVESPALPTPPVFNYRL